MFKVYILDWFMPDMNGIETTRRIRREIGDDVPIIILTAFDWADIEDEAREAGVTAFVSKPLFPLDLHRVLNDCLGNEADIIVAESDYSFSGRKILLAEDNELIRQLGTEISQIPIIAMTANAFEEDRKAALEAGMNDHIAKPIDIMVLNETLAKHL